MNALDIDTGRRNLEISKKIFSCTLVQSAGVQIHSFAAKKDPNNFGVQKMLKTVIQAKGQSSIKCVIVS